MDERTDGQTDGQTDGGDCNIPDAFLKKRGDNKTSKRLKARHFFICQYFSLYEQLKFRANLS